MPLDEEAESLNETTTVNSNESEPDADESELPDQTTRPRPRRVDASQKDAIRANLDSFRELANYSAREAVTKSTLIRVKFLLKLLGVCSGISWAAAGILFSIELWSEHNYRSNAAIVAGIALLMNTKMLFSYFTIRQLKSPLNSTADDGVEV